MTAEGIPKQNICICCWDHFPTKAELQYHIHGHTSKRSIPTVEDKDEENVATSETHAKEEQQQNHHKVYHTDENDIIEQNNIKYASFDDAQKWMLNSGRKIEDVVHDFATKCKNERNAHSCITYPTDPTWKQLNVLTEQELKEFSTY
ncbi:hypothetical protein BGW37DRAFT_532022 [Umbelopsis sp. PMI_123]|nr:hypothetical protein BGW37DRAFT_532022 [Umbelopsis sp. PMI_123]